MRYWLFDMYAMICLASHSNRRIYAWQRYVEQATFFASPIEEKQGWTGRRRAPRSKDLWTRTVLGTRVALARDVSWRLRRRFLLATLSQCTQQIKMALRTYSLSVAQYNFKANNSNDCLSSLGQIWFVQSAFIFHDMHSACLQNRAFPGGTTFLVDAYFSRAQSEISSTIAARQTFEFKLMPSQVLTPKTGGVRIGQKLDEYWTCNALFHAVQCQNTVK